MLLKEKEICAPAKTKCAFYKQMLQNKCMMKTECKLCMFEKDLFY